MGRLSGRSELERAKIKRYEPYTYESNGIQLRWLVAAMLIWIVISVALAWQDRATASLLVDLRDQGFQTAPPARFSTPDLLEFAVREGVACNTEAEIATLTPECSRLLNAQTDYAGVKDTGSILVVVLVIAFVVNMYAFGSFTHRASRNLLTLKSGGQRFTPERSVLWFFAPIFNLVKPWQVFRELFSASDPSASTVDELDWKQKGTAPAIVSIWAALFVAVFFYNSLTLSLFWQSARETISDVVLYHQRLIIADLLLAVLGISAIIVAVELHRRQEARHALVGEITVTPPPPVNPLEEAVKEGIRRKELTDRKSRPE